MAFFYILIFVLGLVFGSFANAWIWRLRSGISVWRGRSMCPSCKKPIVWQDNIPLLSFLVLRGKCRRCQVKISWQYPIVELAMGLVFLICYSVWLPNYLVVAVNIIVSFFLVCIFVYDFNYQEIPDSFSILPAAILLVYNIFFLHISWQNILICIGAGSGFFLLQYVVSKGKWIGGGDIRLGVLIGLAIPNPYLILAAIFLAYLSGAAVGIVLLLKKLKDGKSELPFGTFLTVCTFIVLIFSEQVLQTVTHFILNY